VKTKNTEGLQTLIEVGEKR